MDREISAVETRVPVVVGIQQKSLLLIQSIELHSQKVPGLLRCHTVVKMTVGQKDGLRRQSPASDPCGDLFRIVRRIDHDALFRLGIPD